MATGAVNPSQKHIARLSTASALATSTPNSSNTRTAKQFPSPQEKGLSIEQSVKKFRIFEALRNGDTASISKAIREADGRRMSTNSVTGNTAPGLEDTTILHLAIQVAEQPVIEYVLSDGAGSIDINARDRDGNTPLHIAAQQGRSQIVRLLLEQKEINDSIANGQGRLPIDLARTPEIFQQLQLSRSIYADGKIRQVQALVTAQDYAALGNLLDEGRVKTVLDINGGEFASDPTTVQSGGTLLHEAARNKDTQLIQVLLLHGADPFRRDRRGKLPQDVTKDDSTKAILKKSPAAAAAQRGVQEKAVLGSQASSAAAPGDITAGKEGREMKGYLKKWTNYRKGYQLRWFVLEDGVLSYYKQQDDAGSACRGAINMRIAKLIMDPSEKSRFEIIGKSSVKYHLKANHEIEAKRWYWALNNSIQWTKDQAKEEDKQKARSAELLRLAKAEHADSQKDASELTTEGIAIVDTRRHSYQSSRLQLSASHGKSPSSHHVAFMGSTAGSALGDDDGTAYGSYEPSFVGRPSSNIASPNNNIDDDDDEDYGDDESSREAPANKDAFGITAQSARLQLEMMAQVHAALQAEQSNNPTLEISDPAVISAVATYDGAIRSLKGLVGDLLKISKDRDAYWQGRLEREADMRRMWEESMAQVAREQEELEAKIGQSEDKRKRTKRALREALDGTTLGGVSRADVSPNVESADAGVPEPLGSDGHSVKSKSTARSSMRRKSILADMNELSDDESEDDDEFFDAVDAGEVEVARMLPVSLLPPASPLPQAVKEEAGPKIKEPSTDEDDISVSFKGYENGIRKRLAMDADERPKISLWVSFSI